ncbi:MAG: hypothetical protein K1X86_05745 [Ignavibacteria bacterium]|nr:hypothetical protein [Ignavibacteria bacterium]
MKKFLSVIVVFFCFWQLSSAQQDSGKMVVDSVISEDNIRLLIENIVIEGNKTTEPEIILREMETKPNEYTTVSLLRRDMERLYNLGLFTKIDFIPVPSSDKGYSLIVSVEEGLYILPIPIGGLKDGDFNKLWLGMNVKWRNFRGRNETLGLAFGVFYDPFVNLSYSIPWIGKKQHYFSSFSAGYSVNNNKSVVSVNNLPVNADSVKTYKTFNWNLQASIGKFIFKEFSNSISVGFNGVSTSDYVTGKTLSPDGEDKFVSFGYNFDYDTRDSYEYSLAGASISGNYVKYGFGSVVNYNSAGLNIRKFIPIKLSDKYKISFASRIAGNIFWGGNIADYHHQQLDYARPIRGWNEYVFEGENFLLYSNEIRIPIIEPFYIPGKDMPMAKQIPVFKDLSYKFGMFLALFFDAGGVWNKKDNIFNTRFYNGYGAGLNFILPLGFVGRADWAFRHQENYFKGQLILSLNASF